MFSAAASTFQTGHGGFISTHSLSNLCLGQAGTSACLKQFVEEGIFLGLGVIFRPNGGILQHLRHELIMP
mgnify:CR=1 FL=1